LPGLESAGRLVFRGELKKPIGSTPNLKEEVTLTAK